MGAVQGNKASGATDQGSPVKTGGKYNSTQPTFTDGQRGDSQIDTRGNTKVTMVGLNGTSAVFSTIVPGEGQTNAIDAAVVASWEMLFNGTTWDRQRGNVDGTALASAARSASVNSADLVNYNGKGAHIVIDATAITATPSITVTIQGKDALSGQYYTILAAAAITTVSTTVLKIHPALTAAANLVANDILPRTWRVNVAVADADSITYSVGYSLIV